MKTILSLGVLLAVLLAGCGRSESQTTKEDSTVSSDTALHEITVLKEGNTAYVRMKEYASESKTNATPIGDKAALLFGDAVKLIQKKDGPPNWWLVTKGQTQLWAPAYILTGNKAEVDFLKNNNRIPETMTFICDNVINGKTSRIACGRIHIPGLFVVDSEDGMPAPAYEQGTSPYAIKGNAVVFDVTVVTGYGSKPPVFDDVKRAFQLSPTYLYYCVSDGDKPAFECIDLAALKFRK